MLDRRFEIKDNIDVFYGMIPFIVTLVINSIF